MHELIPLRCLETKSLLLKPMQLDYLGDYIRHFVDYRVIRFLSKNVPWPYPEDGVRHFLEEQIIPTQGSERFCFGIFLKVNPEELIGCIDLWRAPQPENRGFWLGFDFWGHGYMTEACEEMNRLAFEELNFERLYFSNAVGNSRSSRIKRKTGAKFLEIIPAQFVDPVFNQAELWILKREDWLCHQRR